MCLYLCVPLAPSVSFGKSLWVWLYLLLSLSVCPCCPSLFLFVCLYVCLSLLIWLSVCLCVSISVQFLSLTLETEFYENHRFTHSFEWTTWLKFFSFWTTFPSCRVAKKFLESIVRSETVDMVRRQRKKKQDFVQRIFFEKEYPREYPSELVLAVKTWIQGTIFFSLGHSE